MLRGHRYPLWEPQTAVPLDGPYLEEMQLRSGLLQLLV